MLSYSSSQLIMYFVFCTLFDCIREKDNKTQVYTYVKGVLSLLLFNFSISVFLLLFADLLKVKVELNLILLQLPNFVFAFLNLFFVGFYKLLQLVFTEVRISSEKYEVGGISLCFCMN